MLLKNMAQHRKFKSMTHTVKSPLMAALFAAIASTAAADCTAEYKAKQDNPLRLEHGTITVPGPCATDVVTPKVEAALAERGWTLLKILSVSQG